MKASASAMLLFFGAMTVSSSLMACGGGGPHDSLPGEPFVPDPAHRPGGQVVANFFGDAEGLVTLTGGWSGNRIDLTVGNGWCAEGHRRALYEAFKSSGDGGWCGVKQWLTDHPSDCRMILHIGVEPLKTTVCRWRIYAQE